MEYLEIGYLDERNLMVLMALVWMKGFQENWMMVVMVCDKQSLSPDLVCTLTCLLLLMEWVLLGVLGCFEEAFYKLFS